MKNKGGGKRRRKPVAARKRKNNGNKNQLSKAQAQANDSSSSSGPSYELGWDDRISQLPDDILVPIISALSLKEATTTAVLSSRWRHLYTRINRICLPAFEEPSSDAVFCEDYIEAQSKKVSDFVNKIDNILDSCQGFRAFYDFRLRSPDFKGTNTEFERWIEFAFTREAQIIDIGLVCYELSSFYKPYAFSVSTVITKNGSHLPSFKSLKELHLCHLEVDDREVELVVSNFTLLERLSIESCPKLTLVCVVGNSSSRLKHLDICLCPHVESIHVANMTNLVSLRCRKLLSARVLMVDKVPNLAKLITCDFHMKHNASDVNVLLLSGLQPCVLNQLSHLQLELCPKYLLNEKVGTEIYIVPKLINVQHLELQVHSSEYTAIYLAPFIDACPFLEKLEITFFWSSKEYKKRELYPDLFWTKPPNKNLKQVWFSGFLGCPCDLEFVKYIFDKAVALEEFIVEAFGAKARIRARSYFRQATPASVNLIII